ncbi:MAG TPA: hypothetical protein VN608_08045, partial [Clostridia bacterium]|nr:hypothetical protein [Clostridia bacterium]
FIKCKLAIHYTQNDIFDSCNVLPWKTSQEALFSKMNAKTGLFDSLFTIYLLVGSASREVEPLLT